MYVKDMKPNTEYATCDGALIVTGPEKVMSNWYAYKEKQDGGAWSDLKFCQGHPLEQTDPWGKCQRLTGQRVSVHGRGVLVKVYDHDRDFKRTGIGRKMLVQAKDVPGTWAEYTALHADHIRLVFEKQDAIKASQERAKQVQALLREVFPDHTGDRCWINGGIKEKAAPGGKVIEYLPALSIHIDGDLAEAIVKHIEQAK